MKRTSLVTILPDSLLNLKTSYRTKIPRTTMTRIYSTLVFSSQLPLNLKPLFSPFNGLSTQQT